MSVALGYVRLAAVELPVVVETAGSVVVRQGPTPPKLSGKVGGWAEVARAQGSAIVEQGPQSARRLSLDLMIDGWRTLSSVEAQIAALMRLASLEDGDTHTPVVRVSGAVPGADLEWVIDTLDFGDELWDGDHRVRSSIMVGLLEYDPGVLLVTKATPRGGKPRLYQVRKGDTLKSIAAKLLANGNRWREIAELNDRRGFLLTKADIGKRVKVPQR